MGSLDNTMFSGVAYVEGRASGKLLASNLELSFWGGVDAQSSEIIDRHHPLSGHYIQDSILAIPGGRGSCTGSAVMLELLLNGKGPSAIIFQRREDILTLGVMIAEEVFKKSIPVLVLEQNDFSHFFMLNGKDVYIDGNVASTEPLPTHHAVVYHTSFGNVKLADSDIAILRGDSGDASRIAMRIVMRMANLLGATELRDITQVHIDGCGYTGPATLALAEKLRDLGGKVRVPTSLNSISIDQKRWRAQGVDIEFGESAARLASAYTDMGARPTFTCAPYQLQTAPKLGEQVAWAESNAVVYANSVLGAKTMKYPDFLDVCIALTGRAPNAGPHIDTNRLAPLCINMLGLETAQDLDDSFAPLLGYHVGSISRSQIPVVVGLHRLGLTKDDLKAFGAAFATVSSAPMFHIVGVTPEATTLEAVTTSTFTSIDVKLAELAVSWEQLNSSSRSDGTPIDLVSLGNPHFSLGEIRKLAHLCRNRQKTESVAIIVTCGRSTYGLAGQAGLINELEEFGVQIMTDTCWCMISEPVIPRKAKVIMTNSGKYAHYGPGLTGREFYFGSLNSCFEAACQGTYDAAKPKWLLDATY